jgi:hypothetical protein
VTLDADDRATMFQDSGGVLGTSGASSAWGHLENPTAEVFQDPGLIDADRAFVTDADGDLGGLRTGDTLTIGGTSYKVRGPGVRIDDGGLVAFPLADNL